MNSGNIVSDKVVWLEWSWLISIIFWNENVYFIWSVCVWIKFFIEEFYKLNFFLIRFGVFNFVFLFVFCLIK